MPPDNTKIGFITVLKYFWIAIKPNKFKFFFTIFAFVASSSLYIFIPLLYKEFFDLLSFQNVDKTILGGQMLQIVLFILLLNASAWLCTRSGMFTVNRVSAKTMAGLKKLAFDYTLKHSYSFFANTFTGSLVQKVGRFSRSFERQYDTLLFNIIPLIISVTGSIAVVYTQKPIISYIIFLWIIAVITFSFLFQKWRLKYDIIATKADSATSAALADSISNQNTIMSFVGFQKESKKFTETVTDQSNKQIFNWDLGAIKDGVQAAFMVATEFLIFYYIIKYWQQGSITIGTIVLIQAYIFNLSGRLWNFGHIIRNFYESFADSREMLEILETPYEIKDVPNAKTLKVLEGKIEFNKISFAFNQTRTVIDDINFTVQGGEKVAFIGPSGAGKSTLVKLLTRMYDLGNGSIQIDNQDIKYVTQDSLRHNISLVPQDPILFHRTLMDNIRYGKEDATDEEVIEASRLAHCDEFIDSLPLKYETFVGERGIKLSGGERQRVAIARSILKNAPILILDEATSSLDSHSESLIQDALDKLMQDKTTIVIAHRLSTIRKMDRVVVIDNGRISEQGSHDELLGREESLYKKLWELQAGGFLSD
jgi:ATP-binding cassette subfamily B protein